MVPEQDFTDHQRPQATKKKLLETASAVLAAGGKTDDYYLTCIIKARHIYDATGKAVFPWEVDDIPIDWMDSVIALQVDVSNKRERINKVKNASGNRQSKTRS